jgi:hypothetical protein
MRVTTSFTGAQELEQCLEFGAAVATRAARFLGADHLAARRFEGGVLVLIPSHKPLFNPIATALGVSPTGSLGYT